MPSIHDAYINALLADATYALDETTPNGLDKDDLAGELDVRMTPILAEYMGSNFTVVTHKETFDDGVIFSGFDATVWRDNSGKTYVSMQGTTGLGDFITDIDLTISGAASAQIVDMVNWWLKNTTPVGQMAIQIQANDFPVIPLDIISLDTPVPGTGVLNNRGQTTFFLGGPHS